MVETYAVESVLAVKDELAAALLKDAERAAALGEAIKRATSAGADGFKRLAAEGAGAFTGLRDVMGRLDRAMADMAGEATTTGAKFADAGARMSAAFDSPIRSASKLQDAVDRLNKTPIRLQRVGGDPFAMPSAGGSGMSGAGASTVREASRAVDLAATGLGAGGTGGSGGGGTGGAGGPAGPRHTGGHGSGFDGLMTGMFLDLAGQGILDAIRSPVQAAASLQNERLSLQRQLGTSPTAGADYQTANQAAAATAAAMPNITMSAGLKTLGDLYSVTGSMAEAAKMLTPMAAFTTVAQNIRPGSTVDAYSAVRSGEMLGQSVNAVTGQIDPSRLTNYLGLLERAEVATHGKVNEQQMLNFAQTGGMAAKNMNSTGLLQMIPVINELGGFRAGTALQSMYANVVSGVMPQRVEALWAQAGLLNERMVHRTRTGIRLEPGAIRGGDAFQQNPIAWVEQYLIPALTDEKKSRAQIQTAITQMFSRQTGQRAAGMMAGQLMQIQKDYKQEMNAVPTGQAVGQLYGQSFDQNVNNLQGAYNTLMQQLGTTILPTLVPMMQSLTKGIQALTADVAAHPTAARDLLLLGGGIAALAIPIGGTLTAIGALRLALLGLSGFGGAGASGLAASGAAAEFGTVAGTTLASRLVLAGGPIGAAIAGAFLARFALGKLDDLVVGSAPQNVGRPRDGYHPATGAPAPGSSTGSWLGNLWHEATTGSGGRTVNGRALPPSTGGVLSLPAPKAAAPATTPAVTSTALNARGQSADHHALVAAVAQGVTQGMDGATVHMDGSKVGAIVLNKINTAMRQPRKSISSRDNRQNPSMPSQAVGNR